MVITAINMKILPDLVTRLKAVVGVTLDDMIVIHEIKVIEKDGINFLAMPSKTIKQNEHRDIVHPINSETRRAFERLILYVYNFAEREDILALDVKMKYDEGDSVFTQRSDTFEVIRKIDSTDAAPAVPQKTSKEASINESNKSDTFNDTTDDFINWLKS